MRRIPWVCLVSNLLLLSSTMSLRPRLLAAVAALPLVFALPSNLSAQSWSYGPSLSTPGGAARSGATLLVAPAGTYLIGGTPVDPNGNATVQELVGGSWVTTTPLEGLFEHGGAATDELGRVLILAGVDPVSGDLGDNYVWDVANGNNGGIAGRSNASSGQGFAVANDDQGHVLTIGGSSPATFARADPAGIVERYDAATDAWSPLAPMPTPVADAAACNDGLGHVLVFGGYDTNGLRTPNVARLDLATGAWSDTAVPDLPVALAGAEAVLGNNGHVYVIGGSTASGTVASVYILDPVAGTWGNGASMLEAREHFGCAIDAAGYIHAVGGTASHTSERMFTPTCPAVVSGPSNASPYVGTITTLEISVDGSPPFAFQWRRDGVAIGDGPTGTGSEVSGSQTAALTFRSVAPGDGGHVYDCVVSNACGSATSPGAAINPVEPPAFPAAFLVESLHPAGATASEAHSVDGGIIVGETSYAHPQWGTLDRPARWNGYTALGYVDLTPPNSVGGSCSRVRNGAIVGWWWWPYTLPQWGTGYYQHASLWTTAGVHHDMQISGWEIGSIADTDGLHHVGNARFDETSTVSHGFLWTGTNIGAFRLTPQVAWGSSLAALDGDDQFGSVNLGFGTVHAAMWSGNPGSYVDLHPPVAGASRSYVIDAEDGLQIGTVYFGNSSQPCMWSGTPDSYTELTIPGTPVSVTSLRYGLLLGSMAQGSGSVPALFRHGVSEALDLQQFVPPQYGRATVRDVWYDAATGEMVLVGSAYNQSAARTEALVWRSASVAATAERLGRPCPVTIEFTPDGQGGYDVARMSPTWVDDSTGGVEIAAGGLLPADSMSPAQPLGFSFAMPGGQVTTQVFLDDNGRVVADPTATSNRTPAPGIMRLGPAVLAPFWTDLDSAAGSVRFVSDPGAGVAAITWRDVPQAGATNALTFQVQMRSDGSFAFTYADVRDWQQPSGLIYDDVIVGCSGGNGTTDPGAVDFAVYPIASAGNSMVYQRWVGSQAPARIDLQSNLHATRMAWVGGALEVELRGLTSGSLGSYLLLGLQDPAIDVTALLTGASGLTGCVQHVSLDAIQTMVVAGSVATDSLAIPSGPSLIGLPLQVQAVQLAPGESLLDLVLSDALRVIVGG